MDNLHGHTAFTAISQLLAGIGDGEAWRGQSPAIERLRVALCDTSNEASVLDLAVLVRQVLIYEYARRAYEVPPTLRIAHPKLTQFQGWDKVGIAAVRSADCMLITARLWQPNWLSKGDGQGVETLASSENIRRVFNAEGTEGDPFLQSVGRSSYRSPGQRAAVRAALSTPLAPPWWSPCRPAKERV